MRSRDKVLNFIVEYMEENQYSPSIRDICDGTGLRSTSTVYTHLVNLHTEGKIQFDGVRRIKVEGYQFGKV